MTAIFLTRFALGLEFLHFMNYSMGMKKFISTASEIGQYGHLYESN